MLCGVFRNVHYILVRIVYVVRVTNPSDDALSDYQKLWRADDGAGGAGNSFHSYSFYVSPESGDVETPMAYAYTTTGGLLEYGY